MQRISGSAVRYSGNASLSHPQFETLEERQLLNSAPVFLTPLGDLFMTTDGALTIGINGFDADGDAITFSAVSDNPNLVLTIPTGNRYAALTFVQSDGVQIGQIVVQLFDDRSPTATERFVTLATNFVNPDGTLDPLGQPFYTDVDIHRVIQDFMIQTGDAQFGNGYGGSPLGTFADFFDPVLSFSGVGALAMANSGPNSNDCQFFITTGPAPWLDQVHMIFGQVVSGWDVLEILNTVHTGAGNRPDQYPYDPPRLAGIELIDNVHDGTVTMQYLGQAGGVANVTVTMDDGNGGVTQQTFAVSILGFEAPGVLTVQPGTANHQFVANGNTGGSLLVWNLTSPAQDVQVSIDSLTGQLVVISPADYAGVLVATVQVAIQGDTRSVTRSFHVAIQNPGDSQIISGLLPATGATYYSSTVVGNRLYVAAGQAGIEIYDLSDPASPVLLGGYDTPGEARYIEVVGNYAFVSDTFNGLVTLNVADPGNVTLVSTSPMPAGGAALGMAVSGNVLYLASYGAGLRAYNISNPQNVTLISGIVNLILTPEGWVGFQSAMDVVLYGRYAYVSEIGGAVVVLDVGKPSAMKYAGWFAAYSPWGLAISGKTLLVAEVDGWLSAWDLSRPTTPREVGVIAINSGPWHIAVCNEIAVVGNFDGGYMLVDIFRPASMSVLYTLHSSIAGGLASSIGAHLVLPISSEGAVLMDAAMYLNRFSIQGRRTLNTSTGTVSFNSSNAIVQVYMTAPAGGDIERIVVLPLNANAAVSVTTRGGRAEVGEIYIAGAVKSFTAATMNLNGNLVADGFVASLTLGNVTGGTIDLADRPQGDTRSAVAIRLDVVTDSNIVSAAPIKSLTLTQWADTDDVYDQLTAPVLLAMTVRGDSKRGLPGDFAADLYINETHTATVVVVLGKVSIAGNWGLPIQAIIDGQYDPADYVSIWHVQGAIGSIAVKGSAGSVLLRSAGSIASISVAAAGHADFMAGVHPFVGRHADIADDFVANASIGTFTVSGIKGTRTQAPPPFFFVNSNLSAAQIGTVKLQNIAFDNGGEPFGLFAKTSIKSVAYSNTLTRQRASWPANQSIFPEGDMLISLLD